MSFFYRTKKIRLWLLMPFLGLSVSVQAEESTLLKITWRKGGDTKVIASVNQSVLRQYRTLAQSELDPQDRSIAQWSGISLRDLLSKTLDGLELQDRASIDLVILKNKKGAQAIVPRAFIVKHDLLLAEKRNGSQLKERGPLMTVVPWTSRPRVQEEWVPLETFFVSELTEVEVTNRRENFQKLLLKKRRDPFAIRGEKIFLQNCMGCHGLKAWPEVHAEAGKIKKNSFDKKTHEKIPGVPRLSFWDEKGLLRYIAIMKGNTTLAKKSE